MTHLDLKDDALSTLIVETKNIQRMCSHIQNSYDDEDDIDILIGNRREDFEESINNINKALEILL